MLCYRHQGKGEIPRILPKPEGGRKNGRVSPFKKGWRIPPGGGT